MDRERCYELFEKNKVTSIHKGKHFPLISKMKKQKNINKNFSFQQKFNENKINGTMLFSLTTYDCIHLGVKDETHQTQILCQLSNYKQHIRNIHQKDEMSRENVREWLHENLHYFTSHSSI
jgi:hypothetical protein